MDFFLSFVEVSSFSNCGKVFFAWWFMLLVPQTKCECGWAAEEFVGLMSHIWKCSCFWMKFWFVDWIDDNWLREVINVELFQCLIFVCKSNDFTQVACDFDFWSIEWWQKFHIRLNFLSFSWFLFNIFQTILEWLG